MLNIEILVQSLCEIGDELHFYPCTAIMIKKDCLRFKISEVKYKSTAKRLVLVKRTLNFIFTLTSSYLITLKWNNLGSQLLS